MANLRAAKKELRRVMKQNLSQLSDQSIQKQSLAAQEALLALPEYQAAQRISIFLSMPRGEVRTTAIVVDALRQGKEVYVPYTYKLASPMSDIPASVMDMVSLHSQEDLDGLEADSWGIPTPSPSSIAHRKRCLSEEPLDCQDLQIPKASGEGLDMIVMPGMAFDGRLGRLGHGKGYYDFFLTRYKRQLDGSGGRGARMPFLLGLALKQQLLPEEHKVPTDDSDWCLDALIAGGEPVHRHL
ncbi:MAG: hypothetical protein Q9228_000868 [Teloschistes exilis]